MTPTIKGDHVEEQLLGSIVLMCAKHHVQFNFSRAMCLLTGDNTSKGCTALLDAALVYLHFVERVLINEVESAAAVHKDFCKSKAVHDGTED